MVNLGTKSGKGGGWGHYNTYLQVEDGLHESKKANKFDASRRKMKYSEMLVFLIGEDFILFKTKTV